jgi:hypothetical protein
MGISQSSILLFSRWSARYMKTRALKGHNNRDILWSSQVVGFGRFGSARFCSRSSTSIGQFSRRLPKRLTAAEEQTTTATEESRKKATESPEAHADDAPSSLHRAVARPHVALPRSLPVHGSGPRVAVVPPKLACMPTYTMPSPL